jgi:succinyl-diaminopimelate desuccinylase
LKTASHELADPVPLARDLIRCASVTPEDAGAQAVLAASLEALGFTVTRLRFGEIENLFARLGTGSPHVASPAILTWCRQAPPRGPPAHSTAGPRRRALRPRCLRHEGPSPSWRCAAHLALPDQRLVSLLITGDEEDRPWTAP